MDIVVTDQAREKLTEMLKDKTNDKALRISIAAYG